MTERAHAVALSAKVSSATRNFPATAEAFPRSGGRCRAATKGGVCHRAAMTERAQAVSLDTKVLSAVKKLSGAPERAQPYIITLYRQRETQTGIDGG